MVANVKQDLQTHSAFMPGYALDDMMMREVDDLIQGLEGTTPPVVLESDLAGLPLPILRYLLAAGIVGKPRTIFARMRMQGEFRRGIDQKWMPMVSEQYNRIHQPARLWYAAMKFMPLMSFYVRDAYVGGEGNMFAKLTPWYRMFDERNPQLTQGELLVVLNDMVFFPSALLNNAIKWEAIDEHSARASFTAHDLTVSAVFYFNERFDVVDFEADRYQMGKTYALRKWSTPFSAHREINGIRIPTEGEAIWNELSGSWAYARMSLVDVQTNVFSRYP